ncbi:AT-hook motif nuclear-localized protein 10 [Zea mays]|uniref:AT-hook motif nuclear-localized protein n=1 Tax=Zea mays TaxID=4577 RepID=A0A804QD23_MAIZE|nr:AT-hook motif nuclear-localized protein 10 [Zea mays]XP_020397015.1 AT-hook motif nuclear-localized protein 10 [Zea mays]|eukprot:XP_008652867.1 AT-hook motif nuclear-localized protein 10 [Zea mays]
MMKVSPSPEQEVMAGREPFGLPKTPATPPSAGSTQSLRMAYTTDGTAIFTPVISVSVLPATATYQPVGGSAVTASSLAGVGGNGGAGEPVPKKKRGRPRKYGPDGSMSLALVPASMATAPAPPGVSGAFSPNGPKATNAAPSASPDGAKKRGRPKGSTNKKHVPGLGPAGTGFTPHVIFVKAGEDVSAKIMSFPQNGTRAVCVLSANGIVSNVTLRQSATSGGTVTHEGRFEILSLSGSFLLSEDGGHRSRTGGLSVSLAGPDGRVLGGSVAGLLTAASPVQIVVGTFDADGEKKPKQQQQQLAPSPPDPSPAPLKLAPTGVAAGPSSPPSRGTLSLSESSGGAPSPPHAGASGGGGGGYGQQQQPVGFPGLSWK